jgi:hypothetical protein
MWNRSKDRNRQSGFSFPDLPPNAILIQQFGKIAQVDRNELERAQWFWKKRPCRRAGRRAGLHLRETSIIHCVLVFIVFSLDLIYASHSEACYALIIAMFILAVIVVTGVMDLSRYARWKADLLQGDYSTRSHYWQVDGTIGPLALPAA